MRVLTDAIHADLYESLAILFEDRFGWDLYRPIGMDWYESGVWNFERQRLGDQVARQFLEPWSDDLPDARYSSRSNQTHPSRPYQLVTMEQARDLKPDIVLSTLAENDLGWRGFADEIGATFGVQIGNQGQQCAWGAAAFALLSATTPGFTPWMPHVYYRQEFDTRQLFYADGGAEASLEPPWIMNRVQCTQKTPEYGIFRALASRFPECRWTWHGHCEPTDELYGGNAHTTAGVAEEMHQATIAFHAKRWSDGYGHVIHNWAAIGRPMLVTATYYADKLAGPLFLEGKTSYNLEHHTISELETIVQRLLGDGDHWQRMCEDTATRFREVVDFDAEAEAIRAMFERVLP